MVGYDAALLVTIKLVFGDTHAQLVVSALVGLIDGICEDTCCWYSHPGGHHMASWQPSPYVVVEHLRMGTANNCGSHESWSSGQ